MPELPGQAQTSLAAGDEIALLDLDGTIVAVNSAWQALAKDNGGDAAAMGVGVS